MNIHDVKHFALAVTTQKGIIEYAEAMAQVLAEAGRASQKVTGDHPSVAVRKWSKVIEDRALELVRDNVRQLPCALNVLSAEKPSRGKKGRRSQATV